MTHSISSAVAMSFDVAIACFNILAGLVCCGAAVCNYLVYDATLRIVSLMVVFLLSGIAFIGIEVAALCWPATATHVQRQVSHLNSYHGRALHFVLLALLASDSVEQFTPTAPPLILWSWINSIVLASLAFAYVALAVATQLTQASLLPRSMDVRRAAARRRGHRIASGHTAIMGDEDGVSECMIHGGALGAHQRYSSMMEHPLKPAPSSTFLGGDRPLSSYSLTHGLALDSIHSPPSMAVYKEGGLATPTSSAILAPSPPLGSDVGTPGSFSTTLTTPNSDPTTFRSTMKLSPRLQQQRELTSDWVARELNSTEEARFRDNARAVMNRTSTGSLSTEQHVTTYTAPLLPAPTTAIIESYEQTEQMVQGSDCGHTAQSIRSVASRRPRTSESGRKNVADSRPPSSSSTSRAFANIARKTGRRPSNASSFRYETTTDRMVSAEAASPPLLMEKKISTGPHATAYHRELSYDNDSSRAGATVPRTANAAPPAIMQRKRSRRRIFVPSIGRAIDLSSGSESSDGEESDDEVTRMNTAANAHIPILTDDDDDDDASVYSVQSAQELLTSADAENLRMSWGIEPVAPLNVTRQKSNAGVLGRRLTRQETRSVRGKIDRGIKRAMSQRALNTNKEEVEQDPQSHTL